MTIEQTDKLGQDLAVGDIVIVPDTKTSLVFGKIIKLTPKGARIDIRKESTRWNNILGRYESCIAEANVVKRANAIVKIDPQDAMFLRLKGIIM